MKLFLEPLEEKELLAIFPLLPIDGRKIYQRQPLKAVGLYAESSLIDDAHYSVNLWNPHIYRLRPGHRALGTKLFVTDDPTKARIFARFDETLPDYVAGKWSPFYNQGNGFTIPLSEILINPTLDFGVNPFNVFAHELGHALGLSHPDELNTDAIDCVMRSFADHDNQLDIVSIDAIRSMSILYLDSKRQGEYRDAFPNSGIIFVRYR